MNKRQIKIYISGPFTGNKHANIEYAKRAAVRIAKMGYTITCPHVDPAFLESYCNFSYRDYLEMDLVKLQDHHGIFIIDNFNDSFGTLEEISFATDHGIDVFYEPDGYDQLKTFDWTRNRKFLRDYLFSIYEYSLDELAQLMYSADGRTKHGDRGSWSKPIQENVEHMMNHLKRFEQGEIVDRDSGFPPLTSVASRALIIRDQERCNG